MGNSVERYLDESSDPRVCGLLHRPQSANGDALVLTHGAGANCQSPLLAALAAAFASGGMTVLRCDLPFRQLRPHGPPGPGSAARDREGLRQAVVAARKMVPGRVFLGGHSYGGRQASMLAADDPSVAAAMLLLSYPLHPPGKPDRKRTDFFGDLRIPVLFVHGTADPFGSLEELRAAMALIPAPTDLLAVEGAGHDLKRAADLSADVLARLHRLVG